MIKAVVFDLDGTLIDSEPYWKEGEIKVFNAIGVPLSYELTMQTTGLGCQEVIKYWFSRFAWDKQKFPFNDVEKQIFEEVTAITKQKGKVKEGALQVINYLRSMDVPISIASSSTYAYIRDLIHYFTIDEYFPTVFSAVDEGFVKPHPAVYLKACAHFNVPPHQALAFEDSFVGLIAAKAAQMKAVAVLDAKDHAKTRFNFADIKLSSLKQFTPEIFQQLNTGN